MLAEIHWFGARVDSAVDVLLAALGLLSIKMASRLCFPEVSEILQRVQQYLGLYRLPFLKQSNKKTARTRHQETRPRKLQRQLPDSLLEFLFVSDCDCFENKKLSIDAAVKREPEQKRKNRRHKKLAQD